MGRPAPPPPARPSPRPPFPAPPSARSSRRLPRPPPRRVPACRGRRSPRESLPPRRGCLAAPRRDPQESSPCGLPARRPDPRREGGAATPGRARGRGGRAKEGRFLPVAWGSRCRTLSSFSSTMSARMLPCFTP
ncbi:proline-rich protein HaeIII subfamily 1-like [Peromyscus californicus insignis]|uniref:proline-rich protein HaeIII subfamily 1-like n=1 Tax=Peromyscus californicus insignis TaxID=564181 RepID=UPI0022A68323|nr:proline-rich protein HaeIII subfamily 1-like [Peromyscus californicus insignis]